MTMPKPHISEAQRICDRLKADAVVVIAFNGDQMAGASYGATKANCKIAGKWLDQIVDAVCKTETLPAPDFGHCPWPMITQEGEYDR